MGPMSFAARMAQDARAKRASRHRAWMRNRRDYWEYGNVWPAGRDGQLNMRLIAFPRLGGRECEVWFDWFSENAGLAEKKPKRLIAEVFFSN